MTLVREVRCKKGTTYKLYKGKNGFCLADYTGEKVPITQPEAVVIQTTKKPQKNCALIYKKRLFNFITGRA